MRKVYAQAVAQDCRKLTKFLRNAKSTIYIYPVSNHTHYTHTHAVSLIVYFSGKHLLTPKS